MTFNPVEVFVKWIADHVSPRYMAVLGLVCAFLLWAPVNWLKYFRLWEFSQNYRWAIGLTFFVSVAVLIVELAKTLYGSTKRGWDSFRYKRKQKKTLEALPQDQLLLLLDYVHNDRSSMTFQPNNGAVCDLENKGFLYRTSAMGTRQVGFPYSIRPDVRGILTAKKIQKILIERAKRRD
ncbi:MAG: super-infection exclusion protein B [Terracidiphilus sp.]